MKDSAPGRETRKVYRRNNLLHSLFFGSSLVILTAIIWYGLDKNYVWLALLTYLPGGLATFGNYNIGPFKRGLEEARKRDEESLKSMDPSRPWER